jgi:hypothetical protein
VVGDATYGRTPARHDLFQGGHPLVHAARARPDDVASHRARWYTTMTNCGGSSSPPDFAVHALNRPSRK